MQKGVDENVRPATLLQVDNVVVSFPVRSKILRRTVGEVRAVDNVSLSVGHGEVVGLVGESGSGKSSLVRAIAGVEQASAGEIWFQGTRLNGLRGRKGRQAMRGIQMVFQDPYASLNPRQRVSSMLVEAARCGPEPAKRRDDVVGVLLEQVGLPLEAAVKFTNEFSGGQRQRLSIARALAARPELLLCDEAVSSLDVSVQAQIVSMLIDLRVKQGLAYLFISHDLGVVRHIADRVAVMYLGEIVEEAPTRVLYERPRHPYTVSLLSAVPVPDARVERTRQRHEILGEPANPRNPPSGCRFHPRCWLWRALDKPHVCVSTKPETTTLESTDTASHKTACHFYKELQEKASKTYLTHTPSESHGDMPA